MDPPQSSPSSILMSSSISPFDYNDDFDITWYGNIQYLINISTIGTMTCVLIFILLKLRRDHRRLSGPAAIVSKLLAVWHATARQIALHCGADAAQFLLIEGGSCVLLLSLAFLALAVLLPLNLYGGTAAMAD